MLRLAMASAALSWNTPGLERTPSANEVSFARLATPLGVLQVVAAAGALREVGFLGSSDPSPPSAWRRGGALVEEASFQLSEYFAGRRQQFELPVSPVGTAFDRLVWKRLCQVPFGTTVTYGELGRRIGRPQAARAVGGSNHRNPIAIVIPCHRVIGRDGSLVGYASGLELKQSLLDLERRVVESAPRCRNADGPFSAGHSHDWPDGA
jgi:methylated-DNA-[protein]-cysteine S-methyltransferase